jgi:peptidoglycan/LPS O-acetylase OafA/YrhL
MLMLASFGIAQKKYIAMGYSTLFAYNYVPKSEAVNYLSHLWSLAVEEQFYLLWPLVFALLAPRRFALPLLCVGVVFVCYWAMVDGQAVWRGTHYPNRWTIPAIYPIMIGCIAALASDHLRRAMARPRLNLMISCAVVVLLSLRLWLASSPAVLVAEAIGIAGAVSWIYHNQRSRIVLAMEWSPLVYIGTISYGLYIWQGIFTGNGTYRALPSWPPNVWIGVALTFVVAPLSYHLFERPLIRIGNRFRASPMQNGTPSPHHLYAS